MAVTIAGNILASSQGQALPISMGGTGQSTAPTALNALLPVQAGQAGKILVTNGTNVSWSSVTMSPGGSDTMVQFNDSGSFGGNAFLVVNKSTGALTSTSTFKSIGLTISDADALNRTLRYQTLGSDRWLSFANNTTETGANSGSDFEFVRVADNGATTNIVYQISRATGVLDFKVTPTVNGNPLTTSSASNITGGSAGNVVYQSATNTTAFVSNGTTGQVLTSNGSSAPTWSTASVGIPAYRVGFGGPTGQLDSSAKFLYNDSTDTLTMGYSATSNVVITPNTVTQGGIGSTLTLRAGYASASGTGGDIVIEGGYATNYSSGGNVQIIGGNGWSAGSSGAIVFSTSDGVTPSVVQRFAITPNGAFTIAGSAGTSGQVFTSNGSGAPSWTTPTVGAAAAGTLTGTTLASNVVSSSLTSVGTLANLTVTNTITGSVSGNAGTATSATSATTATNIAGGGIGYIPYQTASGTTGFLNAGTSGYVLTSNGTGVAPTWAASSGGVASFNTRTGAITLTSSDVTTALGFTPGTGTVTSVAGTGTVSGLTLTGTVTTTGSLTLGGTLSLTSGNVTTALGFTPYNATNPAGYISSITSGNVTTALGYTPVNKAGDSMSGTLTMDGSHTVTGLPTPVSGSDAASKSYVDSAIAGLEWKNSAAVATTANITLSGLQTIDAYTTLAGDRVLVKNQTTASQNGIYVAATGAWARSSDANTTLLLNNATLYVVNGTTNTDTSWTQTTANPTIGSSSIVFAQFGGGSAYTAGTGISIVGNSISNTGVTSAVAGTNIAVSGATGAVTISVTGTVPTATTAGTVTTAAQPNITSVGTLTSLAVTGAITQNSGLSVGYLEVPQLTGTTFTLSSSGKHFYNTGASTAFVIPANSSVAYPVGTAITFVNNGASASATINVTSDTLLLAGTGATGQRNLGIYGFATALKIATTTWIISGTALT